jgi:hypothetical protein
MRRVAAMMCATAVAVLVASNAYAQAKPNFAGTWVREMPAGDPAGGGGGGRGGGGRGGGWGMEPTITQTATAITIKWMGGGNAPTEQTRTYNLTGQSKNMVTMGRGEPTEQVTTATWEGSKLVLTTGPVKEVISIEGGNLVIERTAPGRGEGAAPTTAKIVYKKKA